MISDLWGKTVETNLDNITDFYILKEKKVNFDWPMNLIARTLNWRKRFFKSNGVNVIANKKILPFKITEDMWEGKKCVVFDYGNMRDYIRQLPNKSWIGFLLNHQNKIVLWFKLND